MKSQSFDPIDKKQVSIERLPVTIKNNKKIIYENYHHRITRKRG